MKQASFYLKDLLPRLRYRQIFSNHLLQLCFLVFFSIGSKIISAQEIYIHNRSNLVMNGNVLLVVNNAAFKNDGHFSASSSTVKFSGHMDTTFSYVSGTCGCTTTFNNLTINKTAFGTSLKSNVSVANTLGVYGGNLYADGHLTLLSDVNFTARVDAVAAGSDILGISNVERYIPSRRAWRLMTAPVTASATIFDSWQNGGVYSAGIGTLISGPGATGAAGNGIDVSPNNNVSMKKYDYGTQSYINILNSKVPISEGSNGSADNTGYFIFLRGDRDVNNFNVSNSNITTLTSTGKLQTGTQTFSASTVANAYTLIGNPYASPVDFNNVTRNNVINRFTVWDPSLNTLGGYVTVDDAANTGTYIISTSPTGQTTGQTQHIQSSQAFFVQTTAGGSASITFNENSKSSSYIGNVFRPMSPGGLNAIGSLRANLYLQNTDSSILFADGSVMQFSEKFSDVVQTEDAVKFTNINENLGFLRHGVGLAIERRPVITLTDTLFLKLWKTTQRAYKFEFVPANLDNLNLVGYLQDKYLNTSSEISLSSPTKINFSVDANGASSVNNRFQIVFKTALPFAFTNLTAYQKNNTIPVEWQVEYETGILKYDIEKSLDGTTFTRVSTSNVTGNNNASDSYNWLDENAISGDNFYRIKMYTVSGQNKYSETVKVVIGTKANGITIYPNPIKNSSISLQMSNQPTGSYQLTMTNNLGQVLYTGALQNNGNNSFHVINLNNKPVTGIYNLRITGPKNKISTQKIIVE